MDAHAHSLIRRIARTAGVVVFLFIAGFAADSIGDAPAGVIVHLIPALVIFVILLVAWRWDWVGGVAFLCSAVAYAVAASSHPSWILAISLPLATTGALFIWSWRRPEQTSRAR